MKITAPAKINLYLDITAVRTNGYHEIETLFQTVSLTDTVSMTPTSGKTVFTLKAPGRSGLLCPPDGNNIVLKAANLFSEAFGTKNRFKVRLEKHIPIQAGMGGGSSDAAAALKILWKISGKRKSPENLKILSGIAVRLGADVPFFLEGGCALGSGIGEKLEPVAPWPKFWAVVVKPDIGLSTKDVYQWFDQDHPRPPAVLTSRRNLNKILRLIGRKSPPQDWCPLLYNCFEKVVFKRVPELASFKQILMESGALSACMSGSGSAFFGIAASRDSAERIRKAVEQRTGLPAWTVKSTGFDRASMT